MRYARIAVLALLAFFPVALSAQSWGNTGAPRFASDRWLVNLLEYPHIRIAPVADAPFSAMMVLDVGTSRSYEQVARDSAGRVFEEMRTLTGVGGAGCMDSMGGPGSTCGGPDPWVTGLIYIDPVQHTAYECIAKEHLCHALVYELWAAPARDFDTIPRLRVTSTSLGTKKIDGLEVVGTRQQIHVRPLPPGAPGRWLNPLWNPTREAWYSPGLQIDLLIKTKSSHESTGTVQIKALKRSEPNPSLFVPPANYKLAIASPP